LIEEKYIVLLECHYSLEMGTKGHIVFQNSPRCVLSMEPKVDRFDLRAVKLLFRGFADVFSDGNCKRTTKNCKRLKGFMFCWVLCSQKAQTVF